MMRLLVVVDKRPELFLDALKRVGDRLQQLQQLRKVGLAHLRHEAMLRRTS